jgi:hypothetical protein
MEIWRNNTMHARLPYNEYEAHGVFIRPDEVLEKRRLEQALNAKEFAVLAGIACFTAREWFRLPGFPIFRGVVFWQDFTQWRMAQHEIKPSKPDCSTIAKIVMGNSLPPRSQKIPLSA